MTMLIPYLLTKFHDFRVYVIAETWNAIHNFSWDQRGNLSKRVTPRVSTDREGHVGPSPVQVGPEGGWPAPPWPIGPTLAPNDPRLGGYGVYEAAMRNPWSLSRFAHKTWLDTHVMVAQPSTSTKPSQPSQWYQHWDPINTHPPSHNFVTHTHTT
jgi:hypothetical protein